MEKVCLPAPGAMPTVAPHMRPACGRPNNLGSHLIFYGTIAQMSRVSPPFLNFC